MIIQQCINIIYIILKHIHLARVVYLYYLFFLLQKI